MAKDKTTQVEVETPTPTPIEPVEPEATATPDPTPTVEPVVEPTPSVTVFDVVGTDNSEPNPYNEILEKLVPALAGTSKHLVATFANVTPTTGYILVRTSNGIYTFARIVASNNGGFESEFLYNVPAAEHALLTKIFEEIGVKPSGHSFMSQSGIL